MKYWIIILIINIISLGEILLSYIANTSPTHTRMHTRANARMNTHACTHTHTAVAAVHVFAIRWVGRPTVTARSAGDNAGHWPLKWNTGTGGPVSSRFWRFFAYKQILGRTETRSRDRMYCQSIRTVRDISRDYRARIATCRLRTSTDRHKENYCIDLKGNKPYILVITFLQALTLRRISVASASLRSYICSTP